MPIPPDVEPPLSPHRAFVIQLRENPVDQSNHFTGRVEHVTSGQATRFSSVEELLAFIGQVLANQRKSDANHN